MEIPNSSTGTITDGAITVSMDIIRTVSGGIITTEASNVTVTGTGFNFDFDSWMYDAADFFGLDIQTLVQDSLENVVRNVVQDIVLELLKQENLPLV